MAKLNKVKFEVFKKEIADLQQKSNRIIFLQLEIRGNFKTYWKIGSLRKIEQGRLFLNHSLGSHYKRINNIVIEGPGLAAPGFIKNRVSVPVRSARL